MAQTQRVICASTALVDGGPGMRFTCQRFGKEEAAFAIRYDGRAYAYFNSCAHVPVELDWIEGEFFDKAGLYLVCATHGATYEPANGHCIMGPCKGQRLVALPVEEADGKIFLMEGDNRDG